MCETVTVVGDFADPLSYLASQRVAQAQSLGLFPARWLAVEADRGRPMGGRPLDAAVAAEARRLALPGEVVPATGAMQVNSRAATAAYAESVSDGVADPVRRALFDALWVEGRPIDSPDVIRAIVFGALNPEPPGARIELRAFTDRLLVPLGDPDPLIGTRRLGLVVSMGRGPLTAVGQRRIDAWRRQWQHRGAPQLPLVLTPLGEAFHGPEALEWLADRLPHGPATVPAQRQTLEPVAAR